MTWRVRPLPSSFRRLWRRGVCVDLELGAGLTPVLGDRVHLQQVLLNVLLNGMDAMAGCAPDWPAADHQDRSHRPLRRGIGGGCGLRNYAGRETADLRALLHHEGPGDGRRPFHRAQHRRGTRRAHRRREQWRRRSHVSLHHPSRSWSVGREGDDGPGTRDGARCAGHSRGRGRPPDEDGDRPTPARRRACRGHLCHRRGIPCDGSLRRAGMPRARRAAARLERSRAAGDVVDRR